MFFAWKGDHGPKHVYVYRNGKFVLKWDLENKKVMEGEPTPRLVKLIAEPQKEGLI